MFHCLHAPTFLLQGGLCCAPGPCLSVTSCSACLPVLMQTAAAQQFRHHVLLQKSLAGWRRHNQCRSLKAAATAAAGRHRFVATGRAVLQAMKLAVAAARLKRRRMVSASLLRRGWLLSRGWRAWRWCGLATALSRPRRIADSWTANCFECSLQPGRTTVFCVRLIHGFCRHVMKPYI